MDPRKAATVTDESLQDAFAQGLVEGFALATGEYEAVLQVMFLLDGIALRVKHYEADDLIVALVDAYKHLEHGEGAEVRLRVARREDCGTTFVGISDV